MRNTKRLFCDNTPNCDCYGAYVSCGSKAVQTGDSTPLTVGNLICLCGIYS